MGRVYSTEGCVACKQRKKKCDERKPDCIACTRLGLTCSYIASAPERQPKGKRGARDLGSVDVMVLEAPGRGLSSSSVKYRHDVEVQIVRQAPGTIQHFFSPVCNAAARDLQVLWQVTSQDDLLKNATVACFSHITGLIGQYRQMDRAAYGRALKLIYRKIADEDLTGAEAIAVLASIQWLGLLSSVGIGTGIETEQDLLGHWMGQCIVIEHVAKTPAWRAIPKNHLAMFLETAVFHISGQSLFSKDLEAIWKVWRRVGIISLLEDLIPRGPDRLSTSPVISGEYTVFDCMFEVTFLHRHPKRTGQAAQTRIKEMEALIRDRRNRAETEYMPVLLGEWPLQFYQIMNEVANLQCNAVLICLLSLQPPTEQRKMEIDTLTSQNVDSFTRMPLIPIPYGTVMWPIQITACAIRHNQDFQKFVDRFAEFKSHIDPGHLRRAEALLNRLRLLKRLQASRAHIARSSGDYSPETQKLNSPMLQGGCRSSASDLSFSDASQSSVATSEFPKPFSPDCGSVAVAIPSATKNSAVAQTSEDPSYLSFADVNEIGRLEQLLKSGDPGYPIGLLLLRDSEGVLGASFSRQQ